MLFTELCGCIGKTWCLRRRAKGLIEGSNEWNGGKDDAEGKPFLKFIEMSASSESTRVITMGQKFSRKRLL